MFTRLKSNTPETSQFDPPTDNYQHQLRDTNSINKTHGHDITSNCKGESGLDWFHSITPSLVDGMALPILTSTQENLNRKPNSSWAELSTVPKQPNCQTEKDILINAGSTLNHDVVSNPSGTITSASEENGKSKKNENMEEKSLIIQEEIKQSERQKDKTHPESLGYVFQKVSKNLRDRRLRELELNHQQCDKEGGGHGERVVSGHSASKNVTDVLDTTSESHTSSTLSSGKNGPTNLVSGKESRFEMEDKRDQSGTKNTCSAVLREKMTAEAETGQEFHAKLSGFIFKPRKMRPLVHNHDLNASSGGITVFQTECNPGSRDLHTYKESRISKQKPVSHEDSSEDPLTDTKKKKIKKRQNQYQNLSDDGGRRKRVSSVREVGENRSEACIGFTSKQQDKDIFSSDKLAQGKTVDRIKGSDERTRVSTSDETKVDSFTCTPLLIPSTCISDPAPSKSGHTKSTMASSTLAKLSRFSFTCRTEPTTAAPTKEERNLPTRVEKSPLKRDGAEYMRTISKDKESQNSPEHSPSGKEIKTVVIMGKVKDMLPPPTTDLTPGQEHEQRTESPTKTTSECKAKPTEPTHAANHSNSVTIVNDGPVDCQSTVNLKKRKCFELGPPPSSIGGSKGLFSGLSLFGSVELSNDVFDTDWDQEVSKKAKI